MNRQKGFTLIELLVVIAIIGVLSAIVMSSLSNARENGANASIKSNMASLRSQVELYNDKNNNYGTQANACTTAGSVFVVDAKVASMISQVQSSAGVTPSCRSGPNPTTSWAVSAQLKGGLGHWCIDSTGISKLRTTVQGPVTAPPSSAGGGC
ncbi:MAG: hypothetical protein A2741_01835 [Candidatus Zambryskibacteria bacterium RIFCSPHIGHO2_01_FULL_43_27]|uniref:Type II secretion system protein GspG C-terminal domain-containing protein n=1 Tax=Candidatus Zambryskibacteria bacterium RIFCSPLOWO2_01_FULL_43_17 TaxID=1802760 RepID=A0A1G2U128_9BACT|nr:MAG: hypothetical protein A2741_01835 [Candidatus Zambryskibacteria bacterium RIFCSPHIGHO2_01_FULL_43_27]OHA99810.1 MAG: hypothetical protein A3E93_01100 [Candidatus Zambryskibacteria bacterium RIFCSPHIGHO2_12_FULL_43_12b]OHB03184.1 MAG: hypothetical protein A2920_02320 [Candidatus Zambryskibacteria bacterium RIFCSPLOWO2_01_FULL_43_17]